MSKKISELTETIEPQDNDILAIVNESETKKVKLANIIAKIKTAFNSVYAAITHTHTKSDITDFPTLSNVATSGSYNDLSDKPSTFTPSSHKHTKSEITDFPAIPSKVSELENDSGFLSSETDPSVPDHVKNITEDNITAWNGKSDFSGSYNDLTDKPTIPSAYTLPTASASTLGGVKVGAGLSISNGVLSATGGGTADSVDWANIQNKPSTYTPSSHTHKKSEITDFPTIPSKTSELTNDSGYITGYTETDPTVPSHVKAITSTDISNWNNKQAPLTAGENITIENGVISASGGGGGGDSRTLIASGTTSSQTINIPSGYDKIEIELDCAYGTAIALKFNGGYNLITRYYGDINSGEYEQNKYNVSMSTKSTSTAYLVQNISGGSTSKYLFGKIEINSNCKAIHSNASYYNNGYVVLYEEDLWYEDTLTSITLPKGTWKMYGIKYAS